MRYISSNRSDLKIKNDIKNKEKISICKSRKNGYSYHVIKFDSCENLQLSKILKDEVKRFIDKIKKEDNLHVFIVGLGNECNTPDSVGPKSLKHIEANSYLYKFGIDVKTRISLLEPGTLGTTGIETKRIIESVKDEIKPDFMIIIDSCVCDKIEYLNKTIQIDDEGIIPGSGLFQHDACINEDTMGIPIISIGVPTAIEIKDKDFYFMCSKDIDCYVKNISKLIGKTINELLNSKLNIEKDC